MSSPPSSTSFSFEPVFLVLAAAAAYGYWRLARTHRPSRARIWVFGIGLALIAFSLSSPLETIAIHYLLLIHLLQNVMIADWAPPLLVLGLTPAMRDAVAAKGGPALALVTRPLVALPFWLAVWYGVHLPQFYDYALRHTWALNAEHALLIAAGLLFWWTVFGGVLSTAGALAYLGVAFVTSAFLGLSPLSDQRLAGAVMLVEQLLTLGACIALLLVPLLRERRSRLAAREPA